MAKVFQLVLRNIILREFIITVILIFKFKNKIIMFVYVYGAVGSLVLSWS